MVRPLRPKTDFVKKNPKTFWTKRDKFAKWNKQNQKKFQQNIFFLSGRTTKNELKFGASLAKINDRILITIYYSQNYKKKHRTVKKNSK